MKIALASDLHLEFADIDLQNTEGADVLILSGDILIAHDLDAYKEPPGVYQYGAFADLTRKQERALRFRNFLKRVSESFPTVIYVAGNHEFYHGKFVGTLNILKTNCDEYPNVFFLEDDTHVVNDVTFIGSTLWTDMNKGDPLTLHAVADMMNDFRIIRNEEHDYTRLRPVHVMTRHRRSVEYIRSVVSERADEKFVVVGHHSPCLQSIHPYYLGDTLMNGAYASDLSEFMMDRPQIKLWTHGHTHHPFDYMVGGTRVVCNPRGYHGHEPQAEHFQLKYIDL